MQKSRDSSKSPFALISSTNSSSSKRRAPRASPTPDWVLDNYDPETTEKPNIEAEIRRLQALKTFRLLDQPVQVCYQRFTSLAARLFSTPIAALSLVDLGRTFFVAQTGRQGREVPRKLSFCAHTILNFQSVLVVPDATADERFVTSPLVQQEGVRFYAGTPLVTPEGYRVGCLAILDNKSRPEGLDEEQKRALIDLAASAMDLMLEKRQGVGHASPNFPYDVQRAAVQLRESLQYLKDDVDFQTIASETHRSLIQSACTTTDHLLSSVVSLRNSTEKNAGRAVDISNESDESRQQGSQSDEMDFRAENGGQSTSSSPPLAHNHTPVAASLVAEAGNDNPHMPPPNDRIGEQTTIQVSKLVENLVSAMEVFPKKAHLAFVVDPEVPSEIVCNDLKVFRSSIALLTSACERTERGFVRFRIYRKTNPTSGPVMLVFECEDTGRDIALEQYHELFQTPNQLSTAGEKNDAEEECITVDPETGVVHRKSFCQVRKGPLSGGFAVYPVARYVQVSQHEKKLRYHFLPQKSLFTHHALGPGWHVVCQFVW